MLHHYLCAVATLATLVTAHGNITSPPARTPGPAMAAACGQNAVASVLADGTTPLEDVDVSGATSSCQLNLCRGAVFADNVANVQTYTPGQTVRFLAQLPIPHEGPMNVSVVDTATNTVVGGPLIAFDSYADENLPKLPKNNTDFSVTMPDLAGKCVTAGECTMQWFWFGTNAQQTYESCVDFVMAPAGSATDAGSADAASAGPRTTAPGTAVAVEDGTSSGSSFLYVRRRRYI